MPIPPAARSRCIATRRARITQPAAIKPFTATRPAPQHRTGASALYWNTGYNKTWTALAAGGHIALIRHGNAPPGYGDPPGFRFHDCKTQRNLDDKGRAQRKALGEAFRSHGVCVDRIVSSPVCRCMDTATVMAVGQVETSWALVPDRDPTNRVRLGELKEMVSGWRGEATLVLISHGFAIEPLTGIAPDQAEVVVLRPTPGSGNGVRVVGRIAPPR